MALLRWSHEIRIDWHYIAPGRPTQKAFLESFNALRRSGIGATEAQQGGLTSKAVQATPHIGRTPGAGASTTCRRLGGVVMGYGRAAGMQHGGDADFGAAVFDESRGMNAWSR
jgi:hypothetical protein